MASCARPLLVTIAGNKFAKEGEYAVVSKDVQEIFSIYYFHIP